jgi:hypothetical protein
MTDSDRLDYALGQIAALKAFCMCAAITHQNPTELQKGFEKFSEMTVAKMLPTVASEAMLIGIDEIKTALTAVLKDAVEHRYVAPPS